MNQIAQQTPVMLQQADMWVVRVDRGNGKFQEYRCGSQSQAQQLAMILRAPLEN